MGGESSCIIMAEDEATLRVDVRGDLGDFGEVVDVAAQLENQDRADDGRRVWEFRLGGPSFCEP